METQTESSKTPVVTNAAELNQALDAVSQAPVPNVQDDPIEQACQTPEIQNELKTMTQAMMEYEAITASTQDIRHKLMATYLDAALTLPLKMEVGTDADTYIGATKFLSEYRQLLNDMDNSQKNQVSIKLKQKDLDTQQQNALNTAELLQSLHLVDGIPQSDTPHQSEEEVDKALEAQATQSNFDIPETELEKGNNQLPEKKVSEEL